VLVHGWQCGNGGGGANGGAGGNGGGLGGGGDGGGLGGKLGGDGWHSLSSDPSAVTTCNVGEIPRASIVLPVMSTSWSD